MGREHSHMANMVAFAAGNGLLYPEAPRWRDGHLWISDVHAFRIKSFDEAGCLVAEIDVPGRPSGLGFLPDGRLLMATGVGGELHLVEDGRIRSVADLSGMARGLLNDMVVDAVGRAYVGDTGYNLGAGEAPRPGRIFLYADGVARTVAEDLNFPNGMAITPDGRTLFVAETFASRILAYDIESDGGLSGRRVHAEVDGTPDGLCLDADGALWIATLARGEFQRIDADGAIVRRIDVAPRHAVACALGGSDRTTLFLCHATVDKQPDGGVRRAGFIETTSVASPGAGLP